jgi:hypothetical protein
MAILYRCDRALPYSPAAAAYPPTPGPPKAAIIGLSPPTGIDIEENAAVAAAVGA